MLDMHQYMIRIQYICHNICMEKTRELCILVPLVGRNQYTQCSMDI